MRSFFATLRRLVLPAGAGSGTARLVLGPDLPPPLDTYLFFGTTKAVVGLVWYGSAIGNNSYSFLVEVPDPAGTTTLWIGHVRAGVVIETLAGFPAGQQWSFDNSSDTALIFNLAATGATSAQDFAVRYPGSGIGPISIGRGLASFTSSIANTAAVAVETTYLTGTTLFKNQRCYQITLNYHCRGAGAATSCIMRLRRITIAGGAYINDMAFSFAPGFTNDSSGTFIRYIRNTTGADITQDLAWTWQPDAGTAQMIGAAGIVGSMLIEDIGAASNFPNVNTVV